MNHPPESREAVRGVCLRYLARREHAAAELRRKLGAKGYPEDLVEEVIAELQAEGLQSDGRCAESIMNSRMAKGYGALGVRQKLFERGIKATPDLDGQDWNRLIESVYVRRYGEEPPATPEETGKRERMLLRRGFSREQVRQLFRRLRNHGSD